MLRSTTLLALTAATFLPATADSAAACNRRRVTYYSQPSTTRVVRTVQVAHRPTTVVKPVSHSTVALVTKKTEISIQPTHPELETGSTVTASANFLGAEQGFVFVQLGSATLQCEVLKWTANSVTFKTPNLGLRKPASAALELVRPDGRIVREFKIALTPKAALVQHAVSDALAIPAQNGPAEPRTANDSGLQLEAPAAPISEVSVVVAQ